MIIFDYFMFALSFTTTRYILDSERSKGSVGFYIIYMCFTLILENNN